MFLPRPGSDLPDEPARLGIVMTGRRELPGWQAEDAGRLDFFDLKGLLEQLLDELHVSARFEPAQVEPFLPGKCAEVWVGETGIGWIGELHPLLAQRYDLAGQALQAAELDLAPLLAALPRRQDLTPVSPYPPVLEDLAVVVDETVAAGRVEAVIREAAGELLERIQLFDLKGVLEQLLDVWLQDSATFPQES